MSSETGFYNNCSWHLQQTIDLTEWTHYFHPEAGETRGDDVSVLIEASRPSDIGLFLQHELQVPRGSRVHVSGSSERLLIVIYL